MENKIESEGSNNNVRPKSRFHLYFDTVFSGCTESDFRAPPNSPAIEIKTEELVREEKQKPTREIKN